MAKKVLSGVVVSSKSSKTVIVEVKKVFPHPKYKKIVTKPVRYSAHNPYDDLIDGQLVEIEESVPVSKTKKWLVKRLNDSK